MLKLATMASVLAIAPVLANAAEPACAARDKIIGQLSAKYQESHRASGLESDTKMVEIWTSPTSGTWTILVTQANGITCIAAAGKNWLELTDTDLALGTAS